GCSVTLVSLAAALAVRWLAFGRRIPKYYSCAEVDPPRSAIEDWLVFRAAFPLLAILLVAYFVTAPFGIPVSFVTCAAALLLMAIAGRWWRGGSGAVVSVKSVLHNAPWQIVLFSIGMYLVVYGLGQAGLTAYGAQTLNWLGQQGNVIATVGTGFLSAIVASVMNNMPSTLIGALAIDSAQVPAATRRSE